MESQSSEDGVRSSSAAAAVTSHPDNKGPGTSSLSGGSPQAAKRGQDRSGSSPASSASKASPTDESKPQESTPSSSSPYRDNSLGALSNSVRVPGSPRSQKTGAEEEEAKKHSCLRCNPVFLCLFLGLIIAVGSIAMTVCGYMSEQIAMRVIDDSTTQAVVDEKLKGQVEKFRTFGPVLIGLGAFITMCACVLLCEARDERKREKEKRIAEDLENADFLACQEHLYELQREVIECENLRNKLQPETATDSQEHKERKHVECTDKATQVQTSPVVLVHGPSLADAANQRRNSQESNGNPGAKMSVLRDEARIGAALVDNSNVPTCSKYNIPGAGAGPELETSFTTPPAKDDSTIGSQGSQTPTASPKSKPERPSKLPPLKSRSVNGPIAFDAPPPLEGVCLCGMESAKPSPKGGKHKRAKRGARGKKDLEDKSAGSDSRTPKFVPRKSRNIAPTELSTHVNPLHDIELHNITHKSPHRTHIMHDTQRPLATSTTSLPTGRSGGLSSLAPVEVSHAQFPVPNPSGVSPKKGNPDMNTESPVRLHHVHQEPCEATSRNNDDIPKRGDDCSAAGGGIYVREAGVEGAACNPGLHTLYRDGNQCDNNSNVCSMSSKQPSPQLTPSKTNILYDVIHGSPKSTHSSRSEVVL